MPQQETYSERSSTDSEMSVTSGGTAPNGCRMGGSCSASAGSGGIVQRAAHPASGPLNGGPQMVETSRDGKRIYLTNSLYASWDAQFYPEGIDGWFVKLDAGEDGSLTVDPNVFIPFSGERPHQVRLSGGDASSDSYCFPAR